MEWGNSLRESHDLMVEEMHGLKGHVNVFKTENLILKKKLHEVRRILGRDDEVFSKWTRDQIEAMSIEEFNSVESQIDQDVMDKKLFLQ
jgi:hypothetical protein